jgi:hypothetical protein
MKKLLLFLCFGCALAQAQTSFVNAIITDGDGQTWNNGKWSASLYNPSIGQNPTVGGVKLTSAQMNLSGALDATGHLITTVFDNNFISPQGTQWQFTLCPSASVQCSVGTTPVVGASPSLSGILSGFTSLPRFPAGSGAFGYLDGEITLLPPPGGGYFNVTSNTSRVWNGSAWGAPVATPSGTAGGALTGTYPNPTIVGAPVGAFVGTTDTQTLTNKTIDGVSPSTMGFVDPSSSIQTQLNGKLGATAVAGGALSGNYPNPLVTGAINPSITGATTPGSGSYTTIGATGSITTSKASTGSLLVGSSTIPNSSANIALVNGTNGGGVELANAGTCDALLSASPNMMQFYGCTGVVGSEVYTVRGIFDSLGSFGVGTSTAAATSDFFSVTSSGVATASGYTTVTNCSSSASPAVCGSAAAGSFAIAAGATTLTINTTAVTANSQIIMQGDESLGTKLGVTCNTTITSLIDPVVTARVAGASFSIATSATIAVNPACFSYMIVN